MTETHPPRVDEVAKYYKPTRALATIRTSLFWSSATLSLMIPYAGSLLGSTLQSVLQAVFLVLVVVYFVLSQVIRFGFVPRAERMRRMQLLSDSFGAPLSHDRTSLYYNNQYSPSMQRLGANTMENAFFSKEIAAKMLARKRLLTGGYLIAWLVAFALRHDNLALLTWITQLVFSGEILTEWLKLEILRIHHERTFEQLHSHFLQEIGTDSPRAIAEVLDAFVAYEATKSTAGILLSTKLFQQLNPILTTQWEQIKRDLKMESGV